jgi:FG-GAP repeat
MAVADVNGDHKPDVVTANSSSNDRSNDVSVLINQSYCARSSHRHK